FFFSATLRRAFGKNPARGRLRCWRHCKTSRCARHCRPRRGRRPLMSWQNPLLRKSSRPLPRCVVVVGTGTIGPDIGYYLKSALPDLKLYLLDVSQAALDRAMQRFADYTEKAVARRKMSASDAEQVGANGRATTDYEVARDADWAIEAATEDLALKRTIFAQLEART